MCKIHIFLSQEFLSLTENKRLRSSQQSCSRGNVSGNLNDQNMKLNHLTFLTLCILLLACSKTKDNDEVTDKLVGTWQLISYSDYDSIKHTWTNPYGLHPKGYFTYTKSGIVNLNISSEEPLKVTADSAKTKQLTVDDFLNKSCGYFGPYTILKEKSTVIHHPKGGSIPWYIGTNQYRQFIIKGDTLFIGDPTFEIGKRVLIKVD